MAARNTPTNAQTDMEAFRQRKAFAKAPAWRPEPGSIIRGTVVGMRMSEDNGYGKYPIITYLTHDTEADYFSVHAFHTLLRNRLAELKTEIGKDQILSYDGKAESIKRTKEKGETVEYHDYYVEHYGENVGEKAVDDDFAF